MTSYTFDNSSLNEVLRSQDSTQQFLNTIKGKKICFYIPGYTMIECFSGTNIDSVMSRWERLLLIYNEMELSHIRLTRMLSEIIKAEIATKGKYSSTPIEKPDRVRGTILFNREEMLKKLPELQKQNSFYKEKRTERKKRDHEFRRLSLEQGLNQNELIEKIVQYDPLNTYKEIPSFIKVDTSPFITGRQLKLAFKRKGYNVLKSFVHLLSLNYLATAYNGNDQIVQKFLQLDENNWVDVFIAACAGYSDFFITEDRRLKEICNHLYSQRAIKFQALTLKETLISIAT